MYTYLITQLIGTLLILLVILLTLIKLGFWKWLFKKIRKFNLWTWLLVLTAVVGLFLLLLGNQKFALHFAMPPNMHSHTPDKNPPSLPILNAIDFLFTSKDFEKVSDIGADPNDVPAQITRTNNEVVKISLAAKEVISEIAPGIYNNYWTFNGQTPGPMLRVLEGDVIELTLTNDKTSLHEHNIDLHAVTGPGGGAELTKVKPGESKTFSWKAMAPGLYIYHCATSNVSVHNSHGQYGLILVQPKSGLESVDKEFYIAQGELYTQGGIGQKGLVLFDPQALLDGNPTYVTFNGKVEQSPRMKVKKGDRVRIYVGNGGVNLVSSFHIIGEIFDKVYPEAAIGEGSAVLKNVQTTTVLPGGASIVEFTVDVPGKYILVDHALARMNKGAWAVLQVEGDSSPDIIKEGATDSEILNELNSMDMGSMMHSGSH